MSTSKAEGQAPRRKTRNIKRNTISYFTPEEVSDFEVRWPDGYRPDRSPNEYRQAFNTLAGNIVRQSPPASSWEVAELIEKLKAPAVANGAPAVPAHHCDCRRRFWFECQRASGKLSPDGMTDAEIVDKGLELMVRDVLGCLESRGQVQFMACGMKHKRGRVRYRVRGNEEYSKIIASAKAAEAAWQARADARTRAEEERLAAKQAAQDPLQVRCHSEAEKAIVDEVLAKFRAMQGESRIGSAACDGTPLPKSSILPPQSGRPLVPGA